MKQDLQLKPKKCDWHKQEVNFLRFMVRINRVKINPVKLVTIHKWKLPTNIKEVQSFLEFINYNRKFIKNYFKKTVSLINLTVKNKL